MLVEKITALQKENQRIVRSSLEYKSEQRKKDREYSANVRSLKSEICTLQTELNAAKLQITNLKAAHEKTVRELRNDNRSLEARVKQIQSSVTQPQTLEVDTSDSDCEKSKQFEVAKLIGHKKKRDGMHYLVRWKNFTSKYDTWEPSKNLHCPKILDDYKKQNGIFPYNL